MARDPNCVFCKVVGAEIPAAVVYEDPTVLAFLDIGPLSEGHLLVIPREHYHHLVDVPAQCCAEVATVLPRLGRALLGVTGAQGFNVLVNNGAAAGQIVPHVHWHLIPRMQGDGLGYRWNPGKYAEGRANQLAKALQAALAASSPH